MLVCRTCEAHSGTSRSQPIPKNQGWGWACCSRRAGDCEDSEAPRAAWPPGRRNRVGSTRSRAERQRIIQGSLETGVSIQQGPFLHKQADKQQPAPIQTVRIPLPGSLWQEPSSKAVWSPVFPLIWPVKVRLLEAVYFTSPTKSVFFSLRQWLIQRAREGLTCQRTVLKQQARLRKKARRYIKIIIITGIQVRQCSR